MSSIGTLLCGHGSKDSGATRAFEGLGARIAAELPDLCHAFGYLDHASPDIPTAFDRLTETGVRHIHLQPLFMTRGTHLRHDISALAGDLRARHPEHRITIDDTPLLAGEWVRIAIMDELHIARREMALPADRRLSVILVGRGGSDPNANEPVYKLARWLSQSPNIVSATAAFCDMSTPTVDEALRLAKGAVVIVPLLLFPGTLTAQLADISAKADREQGRTIHLTGPMGGNEALIGELRARIQGAIRADID